MKWSKPPRREAPHILCGEGAALGPCQNPGDATRTCPLPPPPGPATTSAGPAHPGLMAGQHTHHAAGSYSAHTRMNSSRWCGPRMDESRVRYSKLSMITATKRFSICRTGRKADSGAADSLRPPSPSSQSLHDTVRAAEATDPARACPAASACPRQWPLQAWALPWSAVLRGPCHLAPAPPRGPGSAPPTALSGGDSGG